MADCYRLTDLLLLLSAVILREDPQHRLSVHLLQQHYRNKRCSLFGIHRPIKKCDFRCGWCCWDKGVKSPQGFIYRNNSCVFLCVSKDAIDGLTETGTFIQKYKPAHFKKRKRSYITERVSFTLLRAHRKTPLDIRAAFYFFNKHFPFPWWAISSLEIITAAAAESKVSILSPSQAHSMEMEENV